MESKFKLNEVVWVKLKGFPWWPGIVTTFITSHIIDQ